MSGQFDFNSRMPMRDFGGFQSGEMSEYGCGCDSGFSNQNIWDADANFGNNSCMPNIFNQQRQMGYQRQQGGGVGLILGALGGFALVSLIGKAGGVKPFISNIGEFLGKLFGSKKDQAENTVQENKIQEPPKNDKADKKSEHSPEDKKLEAEVKELIVKGLTAKKNAQFKAAFDKMSKEEQQEFINCADVKHDGKISNKELKAAIKVHDLQVAEKAKYEQAIKVQDAKCQMEEACIEQPKDEPPVNPLATCFEQAVPATANEEVKETGAESQTPSFEDLAKQVVKTLVSAPADETTQKPATAEDSEKKSFIEDFVNKGKL